MDVLDQPDVSNFMVERHNTQGKKPVQYMGKVRMTIQKQTGPKRRGRGCVSDTAQKHIKKKKVEAAAPKGKTRMWPTANAAWTGVQRLWARGCKK